MTQIINVQQAKTHLSRLIERAHAGEEIILTKHGKPYARILPLAAPEKRRLGFMQGHVDDAFFEALPEDELKAWET